MEKGRRSATPRNNSSSQSYLCTFTGIAKFIEIAVGIIVCCCAGIYCHQSAGSNWCSTNPAVVKAYGQIFVVLVGVVGILISASFFLLQTFRCCPEFSWTPMETITLCLLIPAYLAAAIVETWYAAQYDYYTWRDTWSTAAAFAFINTVIYTSDLIFLCSNRRSDRPTERSVQSQKSWLQVGQTHPGYIQGPPAPGHPHHQHYQPPSQISYTTNPVQNNYYSQQRQHFQQAPSQHFMHPPTHQSHPPGFQPQSGPRHFPPQSTV